MPHITFSLIGIMCRSVLGITFMCFSSIANAQAQEVMYPLCITKASKCMEVGAVDDYVARKTLQETSVCVPL